MAMHFNRLLCSVILASFAVAAHAADHAIRVGPHENIVLTDKLCALTDIIPAGWRHSFDQMSVRGRSVAFDPSCWKRVGDEIYVLPNSHSLLDPISRPGASTGLFQQLSLLACKFRVPGISFAGWQSGSTIALVGIPRGGSGNPKVVAYGQMCWRWKKPGGEAIDKPSVYSAFDVKSAVAP